MIDSPLLRLACTDNALADDSKTTAESRAYQVSSTVEDLRRMPLNRTGKSFRPQRRTDRSCDRNKFGNILISISQRIVAIVDDDPGMRVATANLLSPFGYGTETFDSAEVFLSATATSEATCLIVDIQLGDISGVELAHQLAADGLKYPIIFMTALDDQRIRNQAEAIGAIAYLSKPFPPKLLIGAIVEAIGEPMRQG
jgi:CheY-like chemotaxis protein